MLGVTFDRNLNFHMYKISRRNNLLTENHWTTDPQTSIRREATDIKVPFYPKLLTLLVLPHPQTIS